MERGVKNKKKAIINMQMSTFVMPPAGEILVLGKRSSVGPQAAKRMLDSMAPDQFELVELEDELIDAMLIMKYLFLRTNRESLIEIVRDEAKEIMGPGCMISVRCNITVSIQREV